MLKKKIKCKQLFSNHNNSLYDLCGFELAQLVKTFLVPLYFHKAFVL